MKVTILKISRKKEVINREELTNVAMSIREGSVAKEVKRIRQVYHLMRTERQEDGQVLTDFNLDVSLPRICFAAEYAHKNHERQMVSYNGLVVLELNGLDSYEQAVTLRNLASKMPETLMAFLGGSGYMFTNVVYLQQEEINALTPMQMRFYEECQISNFTNMEKQDYVKSLMDYPSVHEMVECERAEAKEEGIQIGIQMGIEQGIEQGIRQGIQQGEISTKRLLARNMLAEGLDPAIVAKISGLTEE